MNEFNIYGRRIRYIDGVFTIRKIMDGVETKNGAWLLLKFHKNKKTGYIACGFKSTDNKLIKIYQHRLVYKAHNHEWDITKVDDIIDHLNRKRDDNNISNLQKKTKQENLFNTAAKGYYFNKQHGKFQCQIFVSGKSYHLGMFVKEEDAISAYQKAKQFYHFIAQNA
jgi:hypothetical protein